MKFSIRREPGALPQLTIAQRVIDKIVHNALLYETETGETLVGVAVKTDNQDEPNLYVFDTITPDESAVRQGAYFEQGDDEQADIMAWWIENWDYLREQNRDSQEWASKWDFPLEHLGDWHKHPQSLTVPSMGDHDTARNYVTHQSPQILAILATVWDRQESEYIDPLDPVAIMNNEAHPLKIPVDDSMVIRIDCWYMSKRIRRFVQLSPIVSDDLPKLPIAPWYNRDPQRSERELLALKQAGFLFTQRIHNIDGVVPFEVCFMLMKGNLQHLFIVVTQADYPISKPTIYTAPRAALKNAPEGSNVFLEVWKQAKPVPESIYPKWESDCLLAEFVAQIEAKLNG